MDGGGIVGVEIAAHDDGGVGRVDAERARVFGDDSQRVFHLGMKEGEERRAGKRDALKRGEGGGFTKEGFKRNKKNGWDKSKNWKNEVGGNIRRRVSRRNTKRKTKY